MCCFFSLSLLFVAGNNRSNEFTTNKTWKCIHRTRERDKTTEIVSTDNKMNVSFKFCIFRSTYTFEATVGQISIYMCMTKVLFCWRDEIVFHITIAKGVVKLFLCFACFFFSFYSENIQSAHGRYIGWQLRLTLFFHSRYFISQAINQNLDQITICFVLSHYVCMSFVFFLLLLLLLFPTISMMILVLCSISK